MSSYQLKPLYFRRMALSHLSQTNGYTPQLPLKQGYSPVRGNVREADKRVSVFGKKVLST